MRPPSMIGGGEHHIRCLYYLADWGISISIHAAEKMGFRLMDIRTNFFFLCPILPTQIRDFEFATLNQTISLPFEHLQGFFCQSRFYQDPHFSHPVGGSDV